MIYEYGWKMLSPNNTTNYADIETVYPVPADGEKYGPMFAHPEPGEIDGRDRSAETDAKRPYRERRIRTFKLAGPNIAGVSINGPCIQISLAENDDEHTRSD